jgi:hypothetical protein
MRFNARQNRDANTMRSAPVYRNDAKFGTQILRARLVPEGFVTREIRVWAGRSLPKADVNNT